ncbi:Gfo/Idh/MocA family protein [Myxococcus sp. RHSTA-1-4]|uniref:Gfo/Idh/MocA family protein n=1 Tax=Myxococcus sp. RHSTA-1-4 TaxID=2874601 RepID=UPI001CBD5D3F|nr:Gfo/Idh/MocA family oxidoreductase [Myxococcus sp. RHSTA-1-4]MBZ4416244.1 Gfo/Idh/MocA family oxidoreductase [Myxococcus sp. RHSTA-1-4]
MSAGRLIRIGVLGAGFARTTQVPAFRALPGVEVVSIASARREKAEEVARQLGVPHVAADWREVVARPDVDLVCIATPPALHRDMTLAALEMGKAVLCEKPTALDAAEAEAMWRAARQRGVLALLDHELRFLPARERMRQVLHSGELGPVRHAHVYYRNDNRAPADRPWDWWSDAAQGGGLLGALGSHAVDALRFLLGCEPDEVLGELATHTTSRPDPITGQVRPVTSDDEARLLLRFGKATASIDLSSVAPGRPVHGLEVSCERGGLRVEGRELWRSTVGGRAWERVELPAEEVLPHGLPDNEWARGFLRYARALTEALRAGRTTVEGAATLEDGWRNQRVLDAARQSHAARRWVRLDGEGLSS